VADDEVPHSQLWLVRHGETEWSASGRHTSHTDVPLTARGRARATDLRARLAGIEFDLVLSSPLGRARETCALAGFGERAQIAEDLREWDYGSGEGLTTAQIREISPGWTVWSGDLPGSEPAAAVGARADRVIARARDGRRTLAFSHGHVSRVIGARWIDLPVSGGARLQLDTAAVSVLGWERDCPVLHRWNDTGPLPT
jgi:broad specificity phosphatase PhoE